MRVVFPFNFNQGHVFSWRQFMFVVYRHTIRIKAFGLQKFQRHQSFVIDILCQNKLYKTSVWSACWRVIDRLMRDGFLKALLEPSWYLMNRNHDFGALLQTNVDNLIRFMMPWVVKRSFQGINFNVLSGVTFVNLANSGRSVIVHVVSEWNEEDAIIRLFHLKFLL